MSKDPDRKLAPHVQAAIAAAAQPRMVGSGPTVAAHVQQAISGVVAPKATAPSPHRTLGAPERPVSHASRRADTILRSRFSGKSAGDALRMLGDGVTATGTLTATKAGKQVTISKTGRNGDDNWNLGQTADAQWQKNHDEVDRKKKQGKKIPWPDKDAEVSVLQQLRDEIVSQKLNTNQGTLSLTANGTSICTYCRRLIRKFCQHYGLTWSNDPKNA